VTFVPLFIFVVLLHGRGIIHILFFIFSSFSRNVFLGRGSVGTKGETLQRDVDSEGVERPPEGSLDGARRRLVSC
jgi:hypothetical protein